MKRPSISEGDITIGSCSILFNASVFEKLFAGTTLSSSVFLGDINCRGGGFGGLELGPLESEEIEVRAGGTGGAELLLLIELDLTGFGGTIGFGGADGGKIGAELVGLGGAGGTMPLKIKGRINMEKSIVNKTDKRVNKP